jgi:glutathione peroxidase
VLAFPCNDFGAQEPGSVEEIQQFCSTTYGVDFPIYAKVAIGAAPFDTLTQSEPAGPVAWNFEKFLIGKDGTVVGRFKSAIEPESAELKAAIEAALAK